MTNYLDYSKKDFFGLTPQLQYFQKIIRKLKTVSAVLCQICRKLKTVSAKKSLRPKDGNRKFRQDWLGGTHGLVAIEYVGNKFSFPNNLDHPSEEIPSRNYEFV